MSIQISSVAPDFVLKDQNGQKQALKDYQGQWLLLYFYPKDNTPGCTTEACMFRDAWAELQAAGIKVLGVSADSEKSHQGFAQKLKLPFPLLSDPDKKLIRKYEALVERSMFGKKFMGIARKSYLINPEGKIAKVYPKVIPNKHAQEVLRDWKDLQA